MKSTRPPRRGPRRARSVWGRIAGYGGAALLVAAAIVVLLVPLLDKHEDGTGAAAALDYRIPIPRLRRMSRAAA